ncbi:MAG: hypothetical protein KDI83_08395 [Gammaproteobacteria bacterium]|nr:hypothetical protein [Gammaproteobacteria bacterium]
MAESYELFGSAPRVTKHLVRKWYLVTNQRNLFFMLAAGLIMPPAGFGKKYYQDTLACAPGWIVLFPERAPREAVQFSVQERSHLLPCLLETDLASITGEIHVITAEGYLSRAHLPDELQGDEQALLVPAPLPITLITTILHRSKEERSACESDAKDFTNVPLESIKRSVSAKPFSGASAPWIAARGTALPQRQIPLGRVQAAGAVMAMLLHFGNLGQQSVAAARMAFDAESSAASSDVDPLLAYLPQWMWSTPPHPPEEVVQRLFWGTVDKLVEWRSSGVAADPLAVILDHFAAMGAELDERMNSTLSKLSRDLTNLAGIADRTATELFERHPKPFSRAMLLLFLRESCAELLEFKHAMLTETDYLAAAILFAARDGWLGLPVTLRELPGLSESVPARIAAQSHRQQQSGIGFSAIPERPKPIRELLAPGAGGWNRAQREAALLLAREGKWPGVQTRITLGRGEYRLEVDGRGLHLLLDGEAKAIQTEMEMETFFRKLSAHTLSSRQEVKVRKVLRTG